MLFGLCFYSCRLCNERTDVLHSRAQKGPRHNWGAALGNRRNSKAVAEGGEIGSSQERALLLVCGSIAVSVAHEGADWILERASRYVLVAARIGIRPAMRSKRYEAYAGLGAEGPIC